jgi:peptidoglycan glycosyltransferase
MWLVALVLLGTQQDLGAGALLLVTFVFMLYLATGRALLPLAGLVVLAAAGAVGYLLSSRIAQRIDIWLNPWVDPQGNSFQVVQSLIALASGGMFGQGLGQGRPDYVPAVHTDFPFAAVGEEFGFIGALALVTVLAVLSLRAWRIARYTPSAYAMLLAGGLAASLTAQTFVIVGGNLGLLPLTGVTLPFVSYGGSSLLVSLIGVGLLLRLSCDHAPNPIKTSPATTTPPGGTDMVLRVTSTQRAASRYAALLCAALFTVLALGIGFRGVTQGQMLIAREDNPRNVDAERAIQRGPLLARDGTPLAYSVLQQSDAQLLTYARRYPHPEVAPVTGYYSLRYGVGGLEEYANSTLRGQLSFTDKLLHRPQAGMPFTTTLDLELQQTMSATLQGSIGSAMVLDWRTGEVLALVSVPTFDANTLDEHWDTLRTRADAPLVNRVTQGLYQPGALLSWMAHHHPNAAEWSDKDMFSLGNPVPFELDNAAVPYPATTTYSETIGQGTLRVTPLRVATVAATLAAGHPVTPTLTAFPDNEIRLANTVRGIPLQPLTTFAQTGKDHYVGWHVEADAQHIWVIALEQHNTNPTRLNAIAAQVRTALQR